MFPEQFNALRIEIEKCRAALRRSAWFRQLLWIIDILFGLLELFVPFPFWGRLLSWLVIAIGNHIITPKVVRKLLEGNLSFHGELGRRHFRPLPIDPNVLATHFQLGALSCIPMAVEFVLKLLGRVPVNFVNFQQDWINRPGGALGFNDFREFDGQTLYGVKFKSHYTPPVRGEAFPLEELFSVIDDELTSGRYVIISLAVPGGWHNYVIHSRLSKEEYGAVTKAQNPEQITDVRLRGTDMRGTDILTYELID
jgi:hypothetical protein